MKASMIALVGGAALASALTNGTAPYTTSTITQTRTSTISECAPTVTACPYKEHPLTTVIVDVYTTYCPVSASETSKPTPPVSAPGSTSTIYSTETLTISKCASTVPNCPYTTKPITTVTSSIVGTTVLPPHTVVPPPVTLSTSAPAKSPTSVTVSSCPPSSVSGLPKSSPTATGTGVSKPKPTTTTAPFTGGANAQKAGGLMMVVGLAAALL